jgi:type IX secretion system substrate protein/Reeler domain-containing protein
MKKIRHQILFISALGLILTFFAFSGGSPGGKSGSPGDGGATCTQCHTGTATVQAGWITSNIPAEGYTAGETYTITAMGTNSAAALFGFELTTENATGQKIGTLAITDATRTKFTDVENHAITHTSSGTAATWTMDWTAPAEGSGEVGVYAAFNAANGNGNTSGDEVFTSELMLMEALEPAITNLTPDSGGQGNMVVLNITGQNTSFLSGTNTVKLINVITPAEIIEAMAVLATSDTKLEAEILIPFPASVGMWNLSVNDIILEDAFRVYSTVGLNELAQADKNQFYPNPASQQLNLEISERTTVSIYSIDGKLIKVFGEFFNDQQVNLSAIEEGLYLLKFESNQSISTSRLIITK